MGKMPEEIADEVWSEINVVATDSDYIVNVPRAKNIIAAAIRADRAEPVSEAEVEAAALALHARENKRGEHGNAILSEAAGKSVKGLRVEPWEECAETFRSDARAALEAARKARTE